MDGVVAFFITTNLDAVLSTIKSRCQIINCFYDINNLDTVIEDNTLDEIFQSNSFVSLWTIKEKRLRSICLF